MAVTIPLVVLIVPDSPFRVRQRFDWPGAILFGGGIAGVLVYISKGAGWGWTSSGCLAYGSSPNLLIGVTCAAVTVALAIILRSGRKPALGGAAVTAAATASAAVEA